MGPACRWCKSTTEAEYVDVGVGMVQVTGGECLNCGAHELGHYQTDGPLSEVEMATGWVGPAEDWEWQMDAGTVWEAIA